MKPPARTKPHAMGAGGLAANAPPRAPACEAEDREGRSTLLRAQYLRPLPPLPDTLHMFVPNECSLLARLAQADRRKNNSVERSLTASSVLLLLPLSARERLPSARG